MEVTPFGRVSELMDLQLLNALFSIVVTVSGIFMYLKEVQSPKAQKGIEGMRALMNTLVREVHL